MSEIGEQLIVIKRIDVDPITRFFKCLSMLNFEECKLLIK